MDHSETQSWDFERSKFARRTFEFRIEFSFNSANRANEMVPLELSLISG